MTIQVNRGIDIADERSFELVVGTERARDTYTGLTLTGAEVDLISMNGQKIHGDTLHLFGEDQESDVFVPTLGKLSIGERIWFSINPEDENPTLFGTLVSISEIQ